MLCPAAGEGAASARANEIDAGQLTLLRFSGPNRTNSESCRRPASGPISGRPRRRTVPEAADPAKRSTGAITVPCQHSHCLHPKTPAPHHRAHGQTFQLALRGQVVVEGIAVIVGHARALSACADRLAAAKHRPPNQLDEPRRSIWHPASLPRSCLVANSHVQAARQTPGWSRPGWPFARRRAAARRRPTNREPYASPAIVQQQPEPARLRGHLVYATQPCSP